MRRLRRQPNLLGSKLMRSELVSVTSGMGRLSFRTPVLVGVPEYGHLAASAAAESVTNGDVHVRRAALSLLLPIGCGASLATVLVNHFETAHSSPPTAQASAELTPKLNRMLSPAEERAAERRLPAGRPSPPRTRVQAGTATHAQRLLRWTPVAGATHYHVVFWRGGTKVLDLWPARPSIAAPHSAKAGKYLWLVYPGRGSRPRGSYGPLVAAGVLVVPARNGTGE